MCKFWIATHLHGTYVGLGPMYTHAQILEGEDYFDKLTGTDALHFSEPYITHVRSIRLTFFQWSSGWHGYTMEVTVDVKFTYTIPDVEKVVKSMDLMTKFKGDNVCL